MTKHLHMSPPPRREISQGPKLFRRILALVLVGGTLIWAGGNGQDETPVAKFASKLSDRWDQSVVNAPHVLPPLLRRSEKVPGKATMKDAGILGSQAAPSLGGRIRVARKSL
jgi:hypothetical protein